VDVFYNIYNWFACDICCCASTSLINLMNSGRIFSWLKKKTTNTKKPQKMSLLCGNLCFSSQGSVTKSSVSWRVEFSSSSLFFCVLLQFYIFFPSTF